MSRHWTLGSKNRVLIKLTNCNGIFFQCIWCWNKYRNSNKLLLLNIARACVEEQAAWYWRNGDWEKRSGNTMASRCVQSWVLIGWERLWGHIHLISCIHFATRTNQTSIGFCSTQCYFTYNTAESKWNKKAIYWLWFLSKSLSDSVSMQIQLGILYMEEILTSRESFLRILVDLGVYRLTVPYSQTGHPRK